MTKLIEPRTLPGFRDFLPEVMAVRKKVINIFAQIFEKYGFQELQTPALEYQDILLGKYGQEAEKLMYLFADRGNREVGMKYDLTVPTARVLAQYPNLPKPFKRYQIQPVWRADKPQKGRYREIFQCDIDTFGTTSPLADAEIIAVIQEALQAVGFKRFTIKINSRRVLFSLLENVGVPDSKKLSVIQSIDKLDKKSRAEVEQELVNKGLSPQTIKAIFQQLNQAKPDENLEQIFAYIKKFAVPEEFYQFDPTISRGLDYYTGAIFETVVSTPAIGSISGGGRYDNLIGQFTGDNIPAVGTTIGLDRTVNVIAELNLWPDLPKNSTQVLVTVFNLNLLPDSLSTLNALRNQNINSEIYLDPTAKLDKQLKYADQKGIPFAIIIGPDEATKNLITLKNLVRKNQTTLTLNEAIKELSNI